MPFRSKSQVRACYIQRSRDLKTGRKPKWNCKLWLAHTKNINKLPQKIKRSRSKVRKSRSKVRKSRSKVRKND